MERKKSHYLVRETSAVLGLPFYLLIVILVGAIIIGVLTLSLQQMMHDAQIHPIEQEINRIITEATNMFEYADEGACNNLQVKFPDSLRFIVFGGLPITGTVEPSLLLNESTSNNYYFVMVDGSIHTYHTNVRFSNQNLTRAVLLHSGVYTLTLELRFYEEKTYVAMY